MVFLWSLVLAGTADAATLKVKADGGGSFTNVKLASSVDWQRVKRSSQPVVVGTVRVGKKQLEVQCWGSDLQCQGVDPSGLIMKMESEFSDECTCGPNGDGPCSPEEDCTPAPAPEPKPEPSQTETR